MERLKLRTVSKVAVCLVWVPTHIRKQGCHRWKGTCSNTVFEWHTVSRLTLCTAASENPCFTFEFFQCGGRLLHELVLSQLRHHDLLVTPYTLMLRFLSQRVFHFWAALRLLPMRSGVCPKEFQWRIPAKKVVKPTYQFSAHDWAGSPLLSFPATYGEHFCPSQQGDMERCSTKRDHQGACLCVPSWYFSLTW